MSEVSGPLFSTEQVEQSIGARFESQVAQGPDRVAIVEHEREYTYDELNRRANQIARAIAANLGPEPARVAIYLAKGFEYLAAIFGVLKAGHAYVPIDPAFPEDRNLYIVENSSAALILTDAVRVASVAALDVKSTGVINLDAVGNEQGSENLALDVSPDSLAYIIYTSGSTGRPKGVMQNHRNALHGCMRRTKLQHITPDDRMSLFYSCSVMGSVYCIFGALLNGAALLPYDFREEGLADLASWMVSQRLTIYHSVASVFRQFAANFDGAIAGSSVRLVIFGGERVLTSDVVAARRVFSKDVHFFTGLGSTETGTIRHFHIGPETVITSRVVPIGYPVEGVEIVLTDDDGAPVPEGEIGEINVHSRYIALGYWNDEEATRRVFSDVPGKPNVRCYKMGDLAQLTGGGMLEHRGRRDFQVKIRGFRVELGEVEAALASYPDVNEALVKAQETGNEHQLVGYVVPRPREDGRALNVRELRNYLRGKLPSYMVPSVFVGLDAFPRTPNGKLDRKALPLPLPSNELADDERVAPVGQTEVALVKICATLLRRENVGTNQNFFDLGGDSLTATQLVARIAESLGVRLAMRSVFAASDLKALAADIDASAPAALARPARGLERVSRDGQLPVTPAQQRMWLIDQLYAGTSAYNISNTVRLRGPLTVPALERAINEMLRRHEVLRTVFPAKDASCWQQVLPLTHSPLPVTDLRDLPPERRIRAARQRAQELLEAPHDLATGPLFSCEVLAIGEQDHLLSLVFNHIIYDNIWSSRIFFQELGELYHYYCVHGAQAEGSPLAPLPFQFVDYAEWERKRLEQGDLSEHLAYWREQLSDVPAILELPSDRQRTENPTFRGGQVAFALPAYVRMALMQFSRGEKATIFMSMLAAWQLLLHRYSGQSDVLVGTPTGRRYQTQTEGMIGLFINNLVMRARIEDGMSFRELVEQVRRASIEAFSHDEIPFENVVRALRPQRASGASPYFQHFFIHRNATNSGWKIPGLEVEPLRQHPGGAKFDLTLSILEDEQQISGTLEYAADLFDHESVERLAANYVQLLADAVENPTRPVCRLQLLSEDERHQVLTEWNPAPVPYPSERCLHHLFEAQAGERPDAIAVIGDTETLTYRDLDRRADRVAAKLRSLGVGPDALVAVCLKRSPDLLVALLGVMKSGGAYVPLDPEFPPERLRYMLDDSKAQVFLTQRSVAGSFKDSGARVVLMEELAQSPLEVRSGPSAGRPEDLAYVIYTSGSTGQPKGVQVEHRGLVNFLWAMKETPGIDSADVVQSLTTICFDIAALELYLPLIVGAKVVISDRETSMSPDALLSSMKSHNVTLMQATPITWRMLLEHGWAGSPKVKVLCGGEAMGLDLAERLLGAGLEVWNMYGPTETTIWSTTGPVRKKEDAALLGRPILNTQLYVTSPKLALQPIGVPGELLIGGDGLARGYLGRAELTRERFIPSPFQAGERLYRTGDLVVRRSDGSIEFMGRLDNQVKIRGFRIELGEIETHLSAHSSVRQSVVVVREDSLGSKKLVAYCIPTTGNAIDSATLHEHLKTTLPNYMLPAVYVSVSEFPKTPNGKIDRKNLPEPRHTPQVEDRVVSQPRDDLDRGLVAVWQRCLGRDDVSIDDDFFALGGDSMLAIGLVKEMQRMVGMEFSLATLFNTPTIRGLVDSGGEEAEKAASIVKLNSVSAGTPVYCLAGVQLYKSLAELFDDAPVYGIFAKRELEGLKAFEEGAEPIQLSTEELAETYADAVERHIEGDELVLAGLSFGGVLALEVTQELKSRGFRVTHVVVMDSILPSSYQRSVGKGLRDCVDLLTERGTRNAIEYIGRRAYVKLKSKAGLLGDGRLGLNETKHNGRRMQIDAFREMRRAFDVTSGKRFDFDVLLVKAARQTLGIGVSLKPDYGLGDFITGQISVAEVDADHIGLVQGEGVRQLFGIVSRYLSKNPGPDHS